MSLKGLRVDWPGPRFSWARALRLTRSRPDAEDLVQETVLRALRFEETFQRGTNLRAWMQQILQSVFISRCRRRVRERRALDRFGFDPTLTMRSTPAPTLRSVSGKMHAAFSSLPERFRRVVELVDLCDYSYREAAEVLSSSARYEPALPGAQDVEEALSEERAHRSEEHPGSSRSRSAPRLLVPSAKEAPSSRPRGARAGTVRPYTF
jgi:RNA polymerase sigma factor (sigma-70 family)